MAFGVRLRLQKASTAPNKKVMRDDHATFRSGQLESFFTPLFDETTIYVCQGMYCRLEKRERTNCLINYSARPLDVASSVGSHSAARKVNMRGLANDYYGSGVIHKHRRPATCYSSGGADRQVALHGRAHPWLTPPRAPLTGRGNTTPTINDG
ncbi:hypothetical protein Bbelb_275900 [Branchiostoma belcheri]|nr:hypothetical protein Bbelb_275900 [Branchiostoma belcheri]